MEKLKLKKGISTRKGIRFIQKEEPGMKVRENYPSDGYSIIVRNKQMKNPENNA